MRKGFEKYIPFTPVNIKNRQWPDRTITKAPLWCSVDLRDGNQALIDPMNLEQKLAFFKMLVDIGFKEIEIGFPSANETEFQICRELIEKDYIPDDVTIQVLVQARPHLIRRTFEALQGAKNAILHFYNSTSTLQRKVVFKKDMDGVTQIAVDAAKLIRELSQTYTGVENLRFEYSPESFSGTEMDNAVDICEKVIEAIGATPKNPIILNLPNTVEMCTPNTHADQIEYFITHLKHRDSAIISLHPHNDRGTAVAAAELGLLAGANRVEGTLFGNGERTGNLDIVTMAMNMYSQGIDPKLNLQNLPEIKQIYEESTNLPVHQRHPYAGELVFTAFSGSHQDAINKGKEYMETSQSEFWEVPYLPIDPADVGRAYEPIIRINSQSGKGGAAFIMSSYGFQMPKAMHPEFGQIVTDECDRTGKELLADRVKELFVETYLDVHAPYDIVRQRCSEEEGSVHFDGIIRRNNEEITVHGEGNGPIDAFFNAIAPLHVEQFSFVSYSEHAISGGSDSQGVAYVELRDNKINQSFFGVGMAANINHAANIAVLCAINRGLQQEKNN